MIYGWFIEENVDIVFFFLIINSNDFVMWFYNVEKVNYSLF